MSDRWIANKFGLFDFWYYDEEEFELSNGKIIFRGTNGSGKSVTTQSFIPLLLDGDKRPSRLDPFGSSARKIENYLLLNEDNEIMGYIYYSDIYDRAEINQIEINFIHRNCGKGSKLLKKAISLVDKNITLEVKVDNIPAINLYKKYGFQEIAIRRGYYNGVDGILMERKKTL